MSAVETAPATAVRLRITEIFASLQGESTRVGLPTVFVRLVGLPTVFVRLTGCPLRCTWCDTEYAFSGGKTRALDDILAEVTSHGLRHVCVTGGEPLAQKGCLPLLAALCDAGHDVSLETSGALDIAGVDPRVSRIVDLKAPGSGELARNRWENLALLCAHDELKFEISVIRRRTAVAGALDPAELAGWIVRDRLPVRFQLQLHKILWNDARGR